MNSCYRASSKLDLGGALYSYLGGLTRAGDHLVIDAGGRQADNRKALSCRWLGHCIFI